MDVYLDLDVDLVRELDGLVGESGRSAFIEKAVRERLEQDRWWRKMGAAIGSISDQGHIWDPDVAQWVHDSRQEDPGSVD